ncbi:MAG: hypothetical protein M1114_00490 [Candidatus Dependentiae bacterium]|nr:hypothetical protein [Candidatus Dependentiae bacterium]
MKKCNNKITTIIALAVFVLPVYADNSQPWYVRMISNGISAVKRIYSSTRKNSFVKKYEEQLIAGSVIVAGTGIFACAAWYNYNKHKSKPLTRTEENIIGTRALKSEEEKQLTAELLLNETLLKMHSDWEKLHPKQKTNLVARTPEQIIAEIDIKIMRERVEELRSKLQKSSL